MMTRQTTRVSVLGLVALVALAGTAAAGGFAPGDKVIAEWDEGQYYSGTVKSADAKEVEVAWTDGSDPTKVPANKTFAIPANTKRKLKKGALGLCAYSTESRWYDCKIKKVLSTGASVAYSDGDAGDV